VITPQAIKLDILKQSEFVKIFIPQGDNIDRKFYIRLMEGTNEYVIPESTEVRFQMTKFNGSIIYNICPVINNQILLEITPAISAGAGRHSAQFRLTNSSTGGLIKSFRFHILLEDAVDIESIIVNTSEFTALQDMELRVGDAFNVISDAENATQNATSATKTVNELSAQMQSAENIRKSNESTRILDENNRVQEEINRNNTESLRLIAENDRESSEIKRESNEQDRITSELERHTDESERISAEQIRIQNETKRQIAIADLEKIICDTNKAKDDAIEATAVANESSIEANSSAINANIATDRANQAAKNAEDIVAGTGMVMQTEKGAPSGVAGLDGDGKVPHAQLPHIASEAQDIAYNDTITELGATDVQLAIEKLKANIDDVGENALPDTVALFGEGGELGEVNPIDADRLDGKPASYFENLIHSLQNEFDLLETSIPSTNLLSNGDFRIWQRGTSFTPVTQAYTVDRWKFSAGVANAANIEKTTTGLKLKPLLADGTLVFLSQFVEEGTKFIGEAMTLSIKLNGAVYKVTGNVLVDDNVVFDISADVKMYFGYSTPSDCVIVTIHTETTTLNIDWVKLELNDHATPFIPQSYAEELRDCQRYCEIFTKGIWGIGYTEKSIIFSFPFKVNKRVSPTFYAKPIISVFSGTENIETSSASIVGYSADTNGTSHFIMGGFEGVATKNMYYINHCEFIADAEI
jgi:hypothetical protein